MKAKHFIPGLTFCVLTVSHGATPNPFQRICSGFASGMQSQCITQSQANYQNLTERKAKLKQQSIRTTQQKFQNMANHILKPYQASANTKPKANTQPWWPKTKQASQQGSRANAAPKTSPGKLPKTGRTLPHKQQEHPPTSNNQQSSSTGFSIAYD